MMLLVDAGNTRIKWAVCAVQPGAEFDASAEHGAAGVGPDRWLRSGTVTHAEAGRLADHWRGMNVRRILISNVAGAAVADLLRAACGAIAGKPAPEWFVSTAERAGIRNAYRHPAQLGSDRFASAIAARSLFPGKSVVIATCGTATTVDAVTADGVFAGGMILPGLGLMASSLAGNTAHLPEVAAHMTPSALFADNTEAAIVSGCLAAQAGAIDRAMHVLGEKTPQKKRSAGAAEIACILSGGAAMMVSPYLLSSHRLIENLVLIGLETVMRSHHA